MALVRSKLSEVRMAVTRKSPTDKVAVTTAPESPRFDDNLKVPTMCQDRIWSLPPTNYLWLPVSLQNPRVQLTLAPSSASSAVITATTGDGSQEVDVTVRSFESTETTDIADSDI